MERRIYLNPVERGAPAPTSDSKREREWIVIAYVGVRTKSLGTFRASSGEAAIGLAQRRHPKLRGAVFNVQLARGHLKK